MTQAPGPSDDAGLAIEVQARLGALALDAKLETGPGTLVLVGPNGAGKTTLLSIVLGVVRPEGGRIAVGPRVLYDRERAIDVPIEERRLGYVPQDYALFPHLDVRGNVEFAAASAPGVTERQVRDETVARLLRELGLDALASRRPSALSGGERQRVALARALAIRPAALLLDEPLAALDVHARAEVRGFLADALTRLRLPTVIVTHDARDVRALGERVAVLERGRVTQTGTLDELARRPASRFVEELIASETGTPASR